MEFLLLTRPFEGGALPAESAHTRHSPKHYDYPELAKIHVVEEGRSYQLIRSLSPPKRAGHVTSRIIANLPPLRSAWMADAR